MLFILSVISLHNVFATYEVSVVDRQSTPTISYIDGTATYTLVFNPSWIEPTDGTNNRGGLLARTQDCPVNVGDECVFCGGAESKASILTYSEMNIDGTFSIVDNTSKVFGYLSA